jgi:hypothetical protein
VAVGQARPSWFASRTNRDRKRYPQGTRARRRWDIQRHTERVATPLPPSPSSQEHILHQSLTVLAADAPKQAVREGPLPRGLIRRFRTLHLRTSRDAQPRCTRAVQADWQSVLPDDRLADMRHAAGATSLPIIGESCPETDRMPRPASDCSNAGQRLWEECGWPRVGLAERTQDTRRWAGRRCASRVAAGKERDNGSACHDFKCTLAHFSSGRSIQQPSLLQIRSLGSQPAHGFSTAIHSLRGAWADRQLEKIHPNPRWNGG